MEKSTLREDMLCALKTRADQLQAQAALAGSPLKRSHALEKVARENGYRDWNAASAAAKLPPPTAEKRSSNWWQDLDSPLPTLRTRIHPNASPLHASTRELMRWAEQLDLIADAVPKEVRSKMLNVVGGDDPYVFVQDHSRWPDGLFRLCNRGCQPWPGLALSLQQLNSAGVIDWEAEHGHHGGSDRYSLFHDDVRLTSDDKMLKRIARLLASVALTAEEAGEPTAVKLGQMVDGFTIDLKIPEKVTAENVARLIASKDDSTHRQLRVTSDGIAFLSDVIGNNQLEGLAFRLETWIRGNRYSGIDASQDNAFVTTVLNTLVENWPNPKASLIDY